MIERPEPEIEAYLEGALTQEQTNVLQAWINADPANAAELLHLVRTHQTLGVIGSENQLARSTDKITPDQLDPVTLRALAEMEATADPIAYPIDESVLDQGTDTDDDAGALSAHDFVVAGGYLLRHTFTPRVIATLSTAAAVLLGVTLLIVMSGREPDQSPVVETPSNTPRTQEVVAILSAERGAVWSQNSAEGASAPGSPLRAGDRLTLIEGFAEITTARGAVAMIQAPATVELLDNDNALRLHSGKLVGICETESAKGFLVRTPNMDITDLGTRFGVAIDEAGQTLTQVFEGSVRVEPGAAAADGFEPQVLLSDTGMAVDAQGLQTNRDRFALDTFVGLQAFAQSTEPADEGIARMAGDVVWSSSTPVTANHKNWPFTEKATIHRELAGHRLGADVPVSFHLPGVYTQFNSDIASTTIQKGTVIRSYFIAFRAEGADGMVSSKGRLTFKGEILGIITSAGAGQRFVDETHNRPDPVFQLSGNALESGNYDPDKISNTDMIEIDQDRKTLSFALQGKTHLDYFRVLVREPVGDQP